MMTVAATREEQLKDSYMIFVLLAILVTPFLPVLLKGKCPKCGKRKLETVEKADAGPYISHHTCSACKTNFTREKSGPLVAVEEDVLVSQS
ncbi:MAG: hypothetical protein JSS86_20675 [Cyanobacteria bacterium SZAS LIN-2]|nr:hypothetical protein [Cyanobacteria bacterium SZAS LIN-3]MBS1998757.1 hypothetical protein [Cyanobacteria bacterium SZAS LIN-2]MBS2005696.1 hypothetical protein [Cyanobacteria bacterium SZAS TMP-1]